jgi:hypothetical protein
MNAHIGVATFAQIFILGAGANILHGLRLLAITSALPRSARVAAPRFSILWHQKTGEKDRDQAYA